MADRPDEVIARADRISAWLREQVEVAGLAGTVNGVSGGVDSALVAALCRRAVGDRALGLILPCRTDPEDIADAYTVASAAGIRVIRVDLDRVFEAALAAVAPSLPAADSTVGTRPGTSAFPAGHRDGGLAAANLKPRLRMAAMYYFANRDRLLVVGTDNRAEIYVGYATKYGDAGVDVQPIAGLLKREVRDMARALGIPEEIVSKPPSAGLWPGQTDEQEMGLSYAQLDEYLATGTARPEIRERIERMHRRTGHKRAVPPSPPSPPPP